MDLKELVSKVIERGNEEEREEVLKALDSLHDSCYHLLTLEERADLLDLTIKLDNKITSTPFKWKIPKIFMWKV